MRPDDPKLPNLRVIASGLPGLIAEPERAGIVLQRLKGMSQ